MKYRKKLKMIKKYDVSKDNILRQVYNKLEKLISYGNILLRLKIFLKNAFDLQNLHTMYHNNKCNL